MFFLNTEILLLTMFWGTFINNIFNIIKNKFVSNKLWMSFSNTLYIEITEQHFRNKNNYLG